MANCWHRDGRGKLSEIDWCAWIDRDVHIDPYLVWADVCEFQGFASQSGEPFSTRDRVPFLVELTEKGLPAWQMKDGSGDAPRVPVVFGLFNIPGAYQLEAKDRLSATIPTRHITASIHLRELQHVLCAPEVRRIQLGLPRIPAVQEVAPPTVQRQVANRDERIVIGLIDDGCAFAHDAFVDDQGRSRVRYLWDQHLTRVPDSFWKELNDFGYGAQLDGEAIARAVALGGKRDRLAAYYAVRYGRTRLDDYSHSVDFTDGFDRVLPLQTMSAATHGCGVMDLAAGYPPPLTQQRWPGATRVPLPYKEARQWLLTHKPQSMSQRELDDARTLIDRAREFDIVFVQLPTRSVMDTSGGSLGVHVLDGLHYIIDRAQRLPYGGTRDTSGDRLFLENCIVVNVSYGAIAGSHDGTSILEAAIRELITHHEETRYLWVVVAAGNAHRGRTHARLDLIPGDSKAFVWRIAPDNPLQSFLEIWIPDVDHEGVAIGEAAVRAISLSVEAPGADPLPMVCMGDSWVMKADDSAAGTCAKPVAGVVFSRRVSQGLRGTMVLVAAGPTRPSAIYAPRAFTKAPHGDWTVFVTYGSTGAGPRIRVHAWTERNDLVFGGQRPQQSVVVGDDPIPEATEFMPEALRRLNSAGKGGEEPLPHPLQPDHALGSLANVLQPRGDFEWVGSGMKDEFGADDNDKGAMVVVGGYRLSDLEVADYSAGGPARDLPAKVEREVWFGDNVAKEGLRQAMRARIGPDADAPSDLGSTVRGLRTVGIREGSGARLSGTSAAAPSVARWIANHQYYLSRIHPMGRKSKELDSLNELFEDPTQPSAMRGAARPTATPRKDDAFRKGQRRAR